MHVIVIIFAKAYVGVYSDLLSIKQPSALDERSSVITTGLLPSLPTTMGQYETATVQYALYCTVVRMAQVVALIHPC